MWLTSSSIGRKFVMALTGICLVLFVTFHVLMNAVALIWPTAYNVVCEFLGANWYALVASAGLAVLFIIHIVYACWLTLQNRKARGADRYAVTSRPPQVEWASKNMLVLGIVILAFLVVHLIQFWAKMQWQELRHAELAVLPVLDGTPVPPAMGTLMLQLAFSEIWTPIVYIIGFIALWFHMNHGFWSMLHTVGWNNNVWMPRLKKIGCWWTSIVVLLFIAQAVVFTVHAQNKYYTTDSALQEQYAEYWDNYAEKMQNEFFSEMTKAVKAVNDPMAQRTAQQEFVEKSGRQFMEEAQLLDSISKVQFPGVMPGKNFGNVQQTSMQIGYMIGNTQQPN
ncbi:MAG: succinate dehydrogenase cytochrome b subunit [Muribaculaceae bacterium]|nr:succinate dehydrogenase cytochrome b subunit [Muribaculaceae bacterium]